MNCPSAQTWLSFSARELSAEQHKALQTHARNCPRCKNEVLFGEALARQPHLPVNLERLSRRAMEATTSSQRPFFVAAAAAVVLVVAGVTMGRDWQSSEFTARGRNQHQWQDRVSAEMRSLDAVKATVTDGQHLPSSTRWALWYRNAETERPLYVLSYLVDEKGELHWLAPAYVVDGREPAPTTLPTALGPQLLGDVTEFDGLSGKVTLITLVSPAPGAVLAFEAAKGVALEHPEVLLPGATVWRRSIVVDP